MALRLATIRAAGRWGQGAAVDVSDMEWECDVALASAHTVAGDASAKMVVERSHGKMTVRALDAIRRNGGKISRRELLRSLGGAVKVRDLNEIIAGLIERDRKSVV